VSRGRILVVDDEPQIRRVMRATLVAEGYEVLDARSGEDALELIRAERFDLALLDINLPGISGIATCREIRTTSDLAVIMMTVRNGQQDKVEALDAGADDYVTKPFGMSEMLARIRAALRRPMASPCGSLPRNSICSPISPLTRTEPSPIVNCCKQSGDPTTATSRSICTYS
jgi:two-component system KDP operon response regulator KdpE